MERPTSITQTPDISYWPDKRQTNDKQTLKTITNNNQTHTQQTNTKPSNKKPITITRTHNKQTINPKIPWPITIKYTQHTNSKPLKPLPITVKHTHTMYYSKGYLPHSVTVIKLHDARSVAMETDRPWCRYYYSVRAGTKAQQLERHHLWIERVCNLNFMISRSAVTTQSVVSLSNWSCIMLLYDYHWKRIIVFNNKDTHATSHTAPSRTHMERQQMH